MSIHTKWTITYPEGRSVSGVEISDPDNDRIRETRYEFFCERCDTLNHYARVAEAEEDARTHVCPIVGGVVDIELSTFDVGKEFG